MKFKINENEKKRKENTWNHPSCVKSRKKLSHAGRFSKSYQRTSEKKD